MPTIILMLKDKVISELPLEKTVVTVGRAPNNDVAIDNLAVSSFHAKILNDNGVYVVEDLNSTNGTFVNDRRVSRIPLNNNDVIVVGKHSLVFSDPRKDDDSDVTVSARRSVKEATVLMGAREPLAETPHPSPAPLKDSPLGGFTVIKGRTDKREYKLAGRLTTIGKSDTAEIRLRGFFAPRVAALVARGAEGFFVSPPGDRREVQVNGVPIKGRVLLKDGDVVDVWKVRLQFSLKG